jgi:hypothetical protein
MFSHCGCDNFANVQANINGLIAREQRIADVQTAFCDLMNGTTVGDIHRMTGLPLARCEEIYNLYQRVAEGK